jgi:hypothetical protein
VNLVEAGVELSGGVALSEGTDLGGVEAGVLELSWECVQFDPIPEIAAVSLDEGSAAVPPWPTTPLWMPNIPV